MRIITTDKGHKVLEIGKKGFTLLGIDRQNCKECGSKDIKEAFYLLLQHKVFCKDCFDMWQDKVAFYPEDSLYEKSEFARLGITI